MTRIWFGLGLAIGGTFLFLAAKGRDYSQVWLALLRVDPSYSSLVVLCSVCFVLVKSWRWTLLLAPLRQFRTSELTPAVYAGSAANLLVPHVGELARIYLVPGTGRDPKAALLASIGMERMLDFAAVLVLFGLLAAYRNGLSPALLSVSVLATVLFGFLLLGVLFAVLWPDMVLSFSSLMLKATPSRWRQKILKHIEAGIAGLQSMRRANLLAQLGFVSIVQWGFITLAILFSIAAAGGELILPASVAVLILMVAGLTLPAAPIHIGTTQIAFIAGLSGFNVDVSHALAASIVYSAFCLLPMVIIGMFFLIRGRAKLGWD